MGTSVPPPFSQILAGIEVKIFLSKGFRLLIAHRILAGIDAKPFPSKGLGFQLPTKFSSLPTALNLCDVPEPRRE